MKINKPSLVIFDLDNTLYDYQSAHGHAQQRVVAFLSKELGQTCDETAVQLEAARSQVKLRLGETGSSHNRLMYISELFRMHTGVAKANVMLSAEQHYWQEFFLHMLLFDGVIEFLTILRLLNVKLVLATDLTLQTQLKKVVWLELDAYFEDIIASEEVGGDKSTGKFKEILTTYISVNEGPVWTIGDGPSDDLLKGTSLHFKKMASGKFHEVGNNRFEFSNFKDLVALLTH